MASARGSRPALPLHCRSACRQGGRPSRLRAGAGTRPASGDPDQRRDRGSVLGRDPVADPDGRQAVKWVVLLGAVLAVVVGLCVVDAELAISAVFGWLAFLARVV